MDAHDPDDTARLLGGLWLMTLRKTGEFVGGRGITGLGYERAAEYGGVQRIYAGDLSGGVDGG